MVLPSVFWCTKEVSLTFTSYSSCQLIVIWFYSWVLWLLEILRQSEITSFSPGVLGQHLKFEDEVEALQVQVDKLETLGYNKIIALGHSGFDMDQHIAKSVRGVDVVIGGHTNTFLYTGILYFIPFRSIQEAEVYKCPTVFVSFSWTELNSQIAVSSKPARAKPPFTFTLTGSEKQHSTNLKMSFSAGNPPSTEVPAGPYPFMVRSNDGRNVPVVQAFAFGKYLGYLKVTFDGAGNVIKAVGNPILMDSSIPQGGLQWRSECQQLHMTHVWLYSCCLIGRKVETIIWTKWDFLMWKWLDESLHLSSFNPN